MGHVIAGFFFTLFGVISGLHCLGRAGCKTRFDHTFLRRFSYGILFATAVGIITEGIAG